MPRHSLLGAAALFSFAGGAAPRVPFILVNYLVVGGGGFDGGGGHAYGGGGGGEVVATSATLSTYATYAASVAGPTGSSSFNNTVARGGGNASEGSHNHGGTEAGAVTVTAGVAVTAMAGTMPLGLRRAEAELVQASMVMVRESGPAQTQSRHNRGAAATVSIGHSLVNTTAVVVVAGGTAD